MTEQAVQTRKRVARYKTAFVDSCLVTVAGSVAAAERKSRGRPRAKRLLRVLAGKKKILVTTHLHPDPDALASGMAMVHLLRDHLPDAVVSMSIKGNVGGGINAGFARLSELRLVEWDDEKLGQYDGIVLLDTQPQSAVSPLPKSHPPLAVIDHHRGRRRMTKCSFCDIRTDVGATSSIIFSYYMELEAIITPAMGASLLFAIESDLAGAAGTPGELDNVALSSLTLIADTRRLYQMRYVALPQSYYLAYASALQTAVSYDFVMVSHISSVDTPEKPAVLADFLLRYEAVQWVLVTGTYQNNLVLSLRTSSKTIAASEMIRKLLRGSGEGGGHRSKAGGFIPLGEGKTASIPKLRETLRKRLLAALKISGAKPVRLVPPIE